MSLKTIKSKLIKKLRAQNAENNPKNNKIFVTNSDTESQKMVDDFPGALIVQLYGENHDT